MSKNSAFTLIEVMAVILIMGLLSGAVVLRLGPRLAATRFEDVLQEVERSDEIARLAARQLGRPSELLFDLSDNSISRREQGGASEQRLAAFHLPRGFLLAELSLVNGRTFGGNLAIPFSTDGYSPTYAIEIKQRDGGSRWLLFAGFGGGVKRISDERQVQSIFKSLGAAGVGNDAG